MTYVPPSRRSDRDPQFRFDERFTHNHQQQHHNHGHYIPHNGGWVRANEQPQAMNAHFDPNHFHQAFVAKSQQQVRAASNPYTREEKPEDEIFREHIPGIDFNKYESISVTITPNDIAPVDSFETMNLVGAVAENVRRCRYTKPTPVQRYSIPVVMAGRDLMACAQTGSGKTAAYLLPAVNFMIQSGVTATPSRTAVPTALVLAPTRELSIQIYEEGRKFTFRTGLRCVVVYGGADPRHQISELTRGCNLLVATPGRLWDMYSRGYVKFAYIRFLILDEADRMLDMGFEPQIRNIVQSQESDMPQTGHRLTLMYSATFPREIQQLAWEFLSRHYFLQVGRVGSTTESISQEVRWVDDGQKKQALVDLLATFGNGLVLVFVEKKRDADYLERALRANRIACTSIHGDRVQREREEALQLFKSGACTVLVATDVASRGLDIPNVCAVVQFDLPSNIEDYVHRIGRTGRAGKTGKAIAFFNDKNRNIVDDLVPLLRETHQEIPQWLGEMVMRRAPPQHSRGPYRGQRGGFGRGGFGFNSRGGFGRGAFQPQAPMPATQGFRAYPQR